MSLQYTGILKFKGEETQVTEKFRKLEFVLTDSHPSYPQSIIFQLANNNCDLLSNINCEEGDEITVHFSLKGREWKNPQGEIKYFNTLDVFRITKEQEENPAKGRAKKKDDQRETFVADPQDDLPF